MKKIFFVYFILIISCFNKAMAESNDRQANCCHLTVICSEPKDAKIRLMNIQPVYRDGIKLSPGRYRVKVEHDGYKSYDEWLDINQVQQIEEVKLDKLGNRSMIRIPPEPTEKPEIVPELVVIKEPEMVLVHSGCFYMGSQVFEEERIVNEQRHRVCIQYNFRIGKYEITFAQYDQFATATNRKLPDDNGWGREQRPVINVSWNDAIAYADWLSYATGKKYRLPMEMEWEYAVRAGTTTAFWSGDCIDTKQANYDGIIYDYNDCGAVTGNYHRMTLPIGTLQPNNLGLFDITGNVLEWTCSIYEDKYMGAEQRCASNINNGNNERRAVRGGSWMSTPWGLRSASRRWAVPNDYNNNLGFRLVEDL